MIPSSFMVDVPGETAEEKLHNEVYRHTGIQGISEQLSHLVFVMMECPRFSLH